MRGKCFSPTRLYHSPKPAENYALLLHLLRKVLKESGFAHVALTMCITGDPHRMKCLPFDAMISTLETINIMTYGSNYLK